jgi:F-type H+-transporting ATPase subunit b
MLVAMVAVTGWSVWAMAQGGMQGRGPGGGPPRREAAAVAVPPADRKEPGKESADEARKEAMEAAREAEEANAPPDDINWTDFGREGTPYIALCVNFGILIAGFYYFGKKPVAVALKARRDTIAKEIEEAQRMRKEAEKRAKHYQAKLAHLEDEVKTTREALVRAGEAERERIVTEAEAKAERMHRDAQFMVEQELKQLRHDLQRDTVEAAIAAAEELLKKRVTQADQERLAEDYLADLARPGMQSMTKSVGGTS